MACAQKIPNFVMVCGKFSQAEFGVRATDYGFLLIGFPDGSDGKVTVSNAGDPVSIPGWVRSPGEGNGNPLHYSCLENSMARGAW